MLYWFESPQATLAQVARLWPQFGDITKLYEERAATLLLALPSLRAAAQQPEKQ